MIPIGVDVFALSICSCCLFATIWTHKRAPFSRWAYAFQVFILLVAILMNTAFIVRHLVRGEWR